jgi:divalent metal cation (Fe/Co/Zn/Cd) transporter
MTGIDATTKDVGREALRRKGLRLVWIGEGWNAMEAVAAFAFAWLSASFALLAFGLDSVVELFAGVVLIWRLRGEWTGQEEAAAERRALKLVGWTFFVLAIYISAQAVGTLVGYFPKPRESVPGIVLVIASAVVMTLLFVWKSDVAKRLGSRALRAEAVESLICDVQDLTVLAGLGLNVLFGWWWADPVAALALVPLLVHEGWEAVVSDDDH